MKPRHWFRFSLRTFFILLTLFGVWLGWQVRIVQHRVAMLKHLRKTAVAYVPQRGHGTWIVLQSDWLHHDTVTQVRVRDDTRRPSWIRRLLGDCVVLELGFDRRLTEADKRAIEAFPEAGIEAWP